MGLRIDKSGISPLPQIIIGLIIAAIISVVMAIGSCRPSEAPQSSPELNVTAKVAMYMLCSIRYQTASTAFLRPITDANPGPRQTENRTHHSAPGAGRVSAFGPSRSVFEKTPGWAATVAPRRLPGLLRKVQS